MSIHTFLASRDPALNFRWRTSGMNEACGLDDRYVEKIGIGWGRFDSMPIYVAGSNQYYHSTVDHDPISISFYVDVGMASINAILDWSKKVYENGKYGLPKDYKKNFQAQLLDNNADTPIGTFFIVGAWPSEMQELDLSYNESNRLILTATFTVDEIRYAGGYGSGQSLAAEANSNEQSANQGTNLGLQPSFQSEPASGDSYGNPLMGYSI